MRFLLSLWWFALVAAQNNDWCSSSSILCGTSANVQTDLSCGVCRSWTYSANIAGNTLRMLGLDGGATAGDGNSNNTYMVYATLDTDFDLTNGKNWLLELLPSSVPNTKNGALWSTTDNSTIFAYGGRVPGDHNIPSDTVLPTLNVQSGDWSTPSSANNLNRLTAGISIDVPSLGKAFYIGGYQDAAVATDAPQDGLAHYATSMDVFDTEKRTPSQVDAPFLPTQNGAGFYIPIKEGLLIFFGGETPSKAAVNTSTAAYTPTEWDHVWIYDIQGNHWYNQPAFNAPDPRTQFCGSILYDNTTQTWQVWAIGGLDSTSDTAVDSVSYLSIPSFQWHTARGAAAMMSTACVNVGPQIFVIGGRNQDTPVGGTDYPAVAYIYDANQQSSKTSYTATHTVYSAPSIIRSAGSSVQTPETWGDAALRELFATGSASAVGGSTTGSDTSTGTITSRTSATPNNAIGVGDSDSGGLSAGAIAGIIVGALVGIALLIAAVILLLKRRRRQRAAELDAVDTAMKEKRAAVEVHAEQRHEMDTNVPPAELA